MPTSGATTTSSNFSKSSTSISTGRRKPLLFLSNLLWRRKKTLEIDDIIFDRNHRTRSEPSVISYSCTMTNQQYHHNHPHQQPPHKNVSMLTMTSDIDQDMHALRLSRQDNPFIQKVLASRESLLDTLDDQSSDDAILMAAEELNPDCCEDPLTMDEVKEHMIRSPPPTTWPRSPQCMFTYNQDNISNYSDDDSGEFLSRNSTRAQDLFMRTTSVPAQSSRQRDTNGLHDIPLHRARNNNVKWPTKGSSVSQLNSSGGGHAILDSSTTSTSMILRPQYLFDEGARFN